MRFEKALQATFANQTHRNDNIGTRVSNPAARIPVDSDLVSVVREPFLQGFRGISDQVTKVDPNHPISTSEEFLGERLGQMRLSYPRSLSPPRCEDSADVASVVASGGTW